MSLLQSVAGHTAYIDQASNMPSQWAIASPATSMGADWPCALRCHSVLTRCRTRPAGWRSPACTPPASSSSTPGPPEEGGQGRAGQGG